jgi:hypothetical protein
VADDNKKAAAKKDMPARLVLANGKTVEVENTNSTHYTDESGTFAVVSAYEVPTDTSK